MLDTLIALTETGEFEDSGVLRFRSAQSVPKGMLLEFILDPEAGSYEQQWQIECLGVREYLLKDNSALELQVVSEHPVMLPFTDHVTDLYFYSASSNPSATVGALLETHRQIVGDWIPLQRFFNRSYGTLSKLLMASSGQLASGPVSLMECYSRVLNEHGIRYSVLPSRPPKYWNGSKWEESKGPLQALILDNSYVVAERFVAQKVTSDSQAVGPSELRGAAS